MLIHTQQGEPENALMEAALTYAKHGWSVFPCNREKKPLVKTGFLEATTDPEQIGAWWRQFPRAEIGIACGASGLVVLDYDQDKDPDLAGASIIAELVDGTQTRMAKTGSGGTHYYFRARPDEPIRNSQGDLGPGIDTRGDGGYVLAPPSRNQKGAYSWLNRATLAPVPDTLLQRYQECKAPAVAASVTDQETGMIPQGRRNGALASLAGTLQRRGTSLLAIEKALLVENQEHCSPPLPDEEVRQIARSIRRYPATAPITTGAPPIEPVVELLATDSVRVQVALADGSGASFLFTEMTKGRRELACHVSVACFGGGDPCEQRLNLDSQSAREAIRRELDSLFGKDKNWAIAINAVWTRARSAFLDQDRSVGLNDIPRLVGLHDLVTPLMPAEGTTTFFGDGGVSKSMLVLALAIAGQTGAPFAGAFAVPQAPVLYIDNEDTDTTLRWRSDRLLTGLGLPLTAAPNVRHWSAADGSLRDHADAIKRCCDEHGVGWIIVDSVFGAAGGAPEEAESAQAVANAIRSIGLPCALIAHINRSGTAASTERPFGSTFWHNFARRSWYIARSQEQESDIIDVALYCRKVNNGPKPRPIGLRLTFDGTDGPITITTSSISGNHELMQHDSLQNQIWAVLDRAMTVKEIADVVDCQPDVAQVTLRRHKDRFTQVGEAAPDSGGRPAKTWGRLAKEAEREIPF